ncbi:Dam family site-specific DNA-(adenine-N6)-methyltransferase [Ligilactobacillus cholophilus]|uniref:Dam family site-specific DNA-(adenine-N6)-methyltransferase n=1 Tax=Ligilactobacillus cholophilus TaxID=3050131 RepID=UPI0025B0152C|nr:Dam family site-specific DNA-(adenine-N6)-methyltransferase [Ligilactobacillus cholophilus]
MVVKGIRSPLFYVGDKYKLMPQLKNLFPNNIDTFFDVFCGGGSSSLNTKAKQFILNDCDPKIIELHSFLQENAIHIDEFILAMHNIIHSYGLSLSEEGTNDEIQKLKLTFKKTYFAKYNKSAYLKMRSDYNSNQENSSLLYLLLIYGFNHMIRFNKRGEFNLPVGNVDWNKNVTTALKNYANWYVENEVKMSKGMDFEEFVHAVVPTQNDFMYFDPPYLITTSDYNKLWNEEDDIRLYNLLDSLDNLGIKWGLSNMYSHKGKENNILRKWSEKYNVYSIKSNYISYIDNTLKKDSHEVYVTNVIKEQNND